MTTSFRIDDNIKKEHLPGRDIRTKKGRQDRIAETLTLNGKRLRDSILSAFFHSYIFAMYKNEALWI